MPKTDNPIYFHSPTAFRRWLESNHATATVCQVGYWKRETGKPTLSWSESVDEALCFGWIDGVRKSIDAERYTIRFTPRKPGSVWSAINVAKVAELEAQGRMRTPGRAAFGARTSKRTQVYSYEQRDQATLTPAQLRTFKANAAAWTWFDDQAPSYRETAIYWVATAKQEATRDRRLALLIRDAAAGRRVGPLRPRVASSKARP